MGNVFPIGVSQELIDRISEKVRLNPVKHKEQTCFYQLSLLKNQSLQKQVISKFVIVQ